MDGNSRWAKRRGLDAVHGHRAGVQALRQLVD
jgi:undecaprenyl diphosphate synthase